MKNTPPIPPPTTPRALGFTLPAEWERQQAVILSAPLNPATWPDNRATLEPAYAAFAAAISHHARLRLLCAASAQPHWMELLDAAGTAMEQVTLHDIPTNDTWCRDHGPVILRHPQDGRRAVVSFHFNAWGGKFSPWDLDDQVAGRLAAELGFPLFQAPLVCEGGALESNGAGLLLTTESVLLNPNRNPQYNRESVEAILRDYLGVDQIAWLPGGLAGDDTDGHIDTLARFCRPDAVLALHESNPLSPNAAMLQRNTAVLQRLRRPDGSRLEVIPLPCPEPLRPPGWRTDILPASYANFLIVNDAVLVPTYRQKKKDREALAVIAQAFPGFEIVPLDCHDIILEGGALHCLSQQVPADGSL